MNPDPKGYYAALDLQPNASPALIRAAYRVRAMELHPDRSDALLSTAGFQRLQEAFDVLNDPMRRAAYDDFALRLAAGRSRADASPTATGASPLRSRRAIAIATGAVTAVVAILVGTAYMVSGPVRADPPIALSLNDVAPPAAGLPNLVARALPTSGILQLDLPSDAFAHADRLPRLTLTAPRDTSYLVKLAGWDDNAPAMSVFVRAGDSTEVLVPPGRYRIRLASGVAWYGEAERFGPTTQYAQVDTLSDFQAIGNRLGHDLALATTSATQIPASAF